MFLLLLSIMKIKSNTHIIIAVTILLLLAIIGVKYLIGSHALKPFSSSKVTPSAYTVIGNKIIGPKGAFQPFGFVVYCLSETSIDPSCAGSLSDTQKIQSAGTFWHANDVRIQAATELLYSNGSTVDSSYVAKLDAEVKLANSLGMIAVVTQQTERAGTKSPAPDANSIKFWQYMSAHYANNPKVFFDLFNEPRLKVADISGGTEGSMWDIWRNGGTVTLTAGGTGTYVGMQTLFSTVRANANNIVIAEVTYGDKDTKLLATHLLNGSNLAYGYEANLYAPGSYARLVYPLGRSDTPAAWDADFGNYSKTYPMMMEAFNDHPSGGCYANSNVVFPQLTSYLQANNLGMTFFTLESGLAVIGNNLQNPTTYPTSSSLIDCSAGAIDSTATIGNGRDLLNWYKSDPQNISQ